MIATGSRWQVLGGGVPRPDVLLEGSLTPVWGSEWGREAREEAGRGWRTTTTGKERHTVRLKGTTLSSLLPVPGAASG